MRHMKTTWKGISDYIKYVKESNRRYKSKNFVFSYTYRAIEDVDIRHKLVSLV